MSITIEKAPFKRIPHDDSGCEVVTMKEIKEAIQKHAGWHPSNFSVIINGNGKESEDCINKLGLYDLEVCLLTNQEFTCNTKLWVISNTPKSMWPLTSGWSEKDCLNDLNDRLTKIESQWYNRDLKL